ncbi:enoyl-CoA hydratase-related protein [Rhizorhabdus argentea]|uniref:enoyl-CoA hydratase-related protein n=1 Tax=Rhizorhabdus argentea TaxID=1387174 RepID=UPI0030EBC223
MTESGLRYEAEHGVATITLDKPDQLNAMSRAMAAALVALIDRADRDEAVRALIVTGAGRAFCAGADLASGALGETAQSDAAEDERDWSDPAVRDFGAIITLRLFDCQKPVIVAFNGPAAGVGATLALAADFRLASTSAKFVFPFVRRGIVPESASSWFLSRIVGLSRAIDWLLLGASVSAEEALAAGLVRSVHASEALMPAARAIADEIVSQTAPVSVALTRQLVWRMAGEPHPRTAHRLETLALQSRKGSADVSEGVASFLEKRPPVFPGRVSTDMPDIYSWWDSGFDREEGK